MALMDTASWLFVLFVCVVCSIACTIISFRKGFRGTAVVGWLVMGFFFSVFALIAIILAPHHYEKGQE